MHSGCPPKVPIERSGGGGGGGGGPTEISYTAFNVSVSITNTTEATAQTVVSAPAHVFDGATKVRLEFFAPSVSIGSAQNVFCEFFDGALGSPLGWCYVNGNAGSTNSNFAIDGYMELTPSAGSHTYFVAAYTPSGGTQSIKADVGGSGKYVNGYIRIVTVT